jgi:alpha-N-arabinofuranosidase
MRTAKPSGTAKPAFGAAKLAGFRRQVLPASLAAACLLAHAGLAGAQAGAAKPARLSIDPATIVSPVSPMLYGMMTEEINHSYDGGLYAELLQNRTFRTTWEGLVHWNQVRHGNSAISMALDKTDGPSHALPTSLKLTVTQATPQNQAGVSNSGFWGIAVRPDTDYHGSFYARIDDAGAGPLTASLVSDRSGAVLATATVALKAGAWSQYSYTLHTKSDVASSSENHLELTLAHPAVLHLQLVSLMPPTYHDRPNGNRADLMERLAGMHGHFLRLPGGNYLEGDRPQDWYNWKETIGPLVDRPGHQAPWTYWSTDGLGLLEFLEWCEDLRIEPVLAVYAGYALNGQSFKAGPELQPYVQSALDEVEYVTGDASTKWGAERAKDGHPAPFPLHYIEIGNEDQFDKTAGSYNARWTQFARALRQKYPQYKLIATTPVQVDSDVQPDLIDDHYYKSPADMMDIVHHYDKASRSGPQIFVGEWATRSGTPTPNFGDALGDAAWMTGLERNSDLIKMASYAPLLVNVSPGAMQWSTDLIGFDAQTTYASPSYYAQSLFAAHLGDGTPKASIEGVGDRFFYSATVGSGDRVLHLKLVNATDREQPLSIDLAGLRGSRTAHVVSLHGGSYEATNSITQQDVIHPVVSSMKIEGGSWQHRVPGLTIEVIDIPLQEMFTREKMVWPAWLRLRLDRACGAG